MDETRFDTLTRSLSGLSTRRAALRLLAGGLVGALLLHRGVVPTPAAQRPDRDGDGLYDDDEVEVYFTNPDVFDTDGDGVGDGEEVYLGTNPLTPNGAPNADPEAAPPGGVLVTCAEAGLTSCGGVCVDVLSDPYNCGGCGGVCGPGQFCSGAACVRSAPVGIDLSIDPGYCAAQGLIDCGGVCVNLSSDEFNCGYCGNYCPLGGFCQGGSCTGLICPDGLTDCGIGRCVDLMTNNSHCGRCGGGCFDSIFGTYTCVNGGCVD